MAYRVFELFGEDGETIDDMSEAFRRAIDAASEKALTNGDSSNFVVVREEDDTVLLNAAITLFPGVES